MFCVQGRANGVGPSSGDLKDGGLQWMSPDPFILRVPFSLEGLPGSDGDSGADSISLSLLLCDGFAVFVTNHTELPVF